MFERFTIGCHRQARATGLCVELIDAILEHVTSPGDLYVLSLVSRTWNARATSLLCATLLVLSDRPLLTLALLDAIERDKHRAALVHTVIFDARGRQRTARRYSQQHVPLFSVARGQQSALRRLAQRLVEVLPLLRNVRVVRMAHVHPLLMSVHAAVRHISLARTLAHAVSGRFHMRKYHDLFGGAPTTWSALAGTDEPRPQARIERLIARLWARCAPPPGALAHLRVLSLSWTLFYDWTADWSNALQSVPRLDALMLSDVTTSGLSMFLGRLLDNIYAPRLRELVLYRLRIVPWAPDLRMFMAFMARHCATLESVCVALRPNARDHSVAAVLGLNAASPLSFPRLRRLRLHNAAAYECTSCALAAAPVHRARDAAFPATLLEFLRIHMGSLRDIGVTGLDELSRRNFDDLLESFDGRQVLVGGGPPRGTTLPTDVRKRERWIRDVFLLEGTEFESEPCDAPKGVPVLRKVHG